MYFQISDSIEQRLEAFTGVNAEFYNVQYENTIVPAQVLLVEFIETPDALRISKTADKELVRVRVHAVTKAVSATSGKILNKAKLNNDVLAANVVAALKDFVPTSGSAILTTPLKHKGRKPWQRYKGYLVMFVEFEAKILA